MNTKDAIKYYEGAILPSWIGHPFLGDAKAYVTLNSLFFEGVEVEKQRLLEGKKLNPNIVDKAYYPLLKDVIKTLVILAKDEQNTNKQVSTTRVERLVDYQFLLKQKRTTSFISTCKGDFLQAYMNKENLVLMSFHLPAKSAYIDFKKVLKDDYLKDEEQEILLPPNVSLVFKERPLTEQEKLLKDLNGLPPVLACDVFPEATYTTKVNEENLDVDKQLDYLRKVMFKLINNEKLTKSEIVKYTRCKKELIYSIII